MAAAGTVRTLPGRYAKFLTALAGNALVYATATWGAANRWVDLATAAAAALGVLAVPNTPASSPVSPPSPASRGGYPAGGTLVSDLAPPPPSVTALQAPPPAPPAGPVA